LANSKLAGCLFACETGAFGPAPLSHLAGLSGPSAAPKDVRHALLADLVALPPALPPLRRRVESVGERTLSIWTSTGLIAKYRATCETVSPVWKSARS